MERMLVGVATRRHDAVNEPVGDALDVTASSTSKSAVSRRFKQATEAQLVELMGRDLAALDICVLLVDGVHCADRCCVIALAITADGTKVPVGLWIGDTENKTIVKALLADLVAGGLSADGGLLILMDGAKALAAAVADVFGDLAVVQRCTLHKRRSVTGHLPKDQQKWVDVKLAAAFANVDVIAGKRAVVALAKQIESRIQTPPVRCWKASIRCSPFLGSNRHDRAAVVARAARNVRNGSRAAAGRTTRQADARLRRCPPSTL